MARKEASSAVRTVFLCSACGNDSPKWFGRCPHCGEWNTAVEEAQRAAAPPSRRGDGSGAARPTRRTEIEALAEERHRSGIGELDRVLGGGLVPGSLVLIGGDPGIGKSTLALQLAGALARDGRGVLYVSREESPRQAKMRAERTALRGGADHPSLHPYTHSDAITADVQRLKPSGRLLRDRGRSVPGSAVVASLEGSRPLLVEVQALVAPTHFANPQRVAQGVDVRRLAVVIAVLEKRAGLSLAGADVFVNVAGGIELEEPAADLGLALALASSV